MSAKPTYTMIFKQRNVIQWKSNYFVEFTKFVHTSHNFGSEVSANSHAHTPQVKLWGQTNFVFAISLWREYYVSSDTVAEVPSLESLDG